MVTDILVSTKAVPEGIRNVNKMITVMERYQESKALGTVLAARKEVEAKAARDDDNEAEEEEDEVHDLKTQREQSSGTLLHERNVNEHGSRHLPSNRSNNAIEKKRSSTFRVFWKSFKQNLGYGSSPAKTNRVIVMAIVLAILGPTIARLRRQRR